MKRNFMKKLFEKKQKENIITQHNPFSKYLTKEDHLHSQIAQYLNMQYPQCLWIHCPNEGKRSVFERYKAKILGLKSGIPDFLIFEQKVIEYKALNVNGGTCGLAIELKIKPNKPTLNQLLFLENFNIRKWFTVVCYSFEEAKEIIDWYLENTPGEEPQPDPILTNNQDTRS